MAVWRDDGQAVNSTEISSSCGNGLGVSGVLVPESKGFFPRGN